MAKKYGIVFMKDGNHPDATGAEIMSWQQSNGQDETWDDFGEALEACELGGWTGYVRYYPTGDKVIDEE